MLLASPAGIEPAIFPSYHYGFRRPEAGLWSGLSLNLGNAALGCACRVSTRSWRPGFARYCLVLVHRGFTDVKRIHTGAFAPGAQYSGGESYIHLTMETLKYYLIPAKIGLLAGISTDFVSARLRFYHYLPHRFAPSPAAFRASAPASGRRHAARRIPPKKARIGKTRTRINRPAAIAMGRRSPGQAGPAPGFASGQHHNASIWL